jgi:hypothetical protein
LKILFVGDVYGSAGRDMLADHLVNLQREHEIDVTIVNAENTTNGRGLNTKHYDMLSRLPIDMMTMGNHTFGQAEIFDYLQDATNLIRPLNGHPNWPGTGYKIIERLDKRIAIINLLGSVGITSAENPFIAFDRLYEQIKNEADLIIVDFHAEATSEKVAFGYYVADRAVLCAGTHTHVQTADERILDNRCAYISDVGMTGPLDGVIGVDRDIVIQRFLKDYPARFTMAKGAKQLNAIVVDICPNEHKAVDIRRVHVENA